MTDDFQRLGSMIATLLDPALSPLGFAPAQGPRDATGGNAQFIFCRGYTDSVDDGCLDLVVDFACDQDGSFHVNDVRYWGFESDSWHLEFERTGNCEEQIGNLADRLPALLR